MTHARKLRDQHTAFLHISNTLPSSCFCVWRIEYCYSTVTVLSQAGQLASLMPGPLSSLGVIGPRALCVPQVLSSPGLLNHWPRFLTSLSLVCSFLLASGIICFPSPDFGCGCVTCLGQWALAAVTQRRGAVCLGRWRRPSCVSQSPRKVLFHVN